MNEFIDRKMVYMLYGVCLILLITGLFVFSKKPKTTLESPMAVMDILWQQSYTYKIPNMTVTACKSDIFGQNVQSKTLPNGRVMQYYYNKEQATLYYHIVC